MFISDRRDRKRDIKEATVLAHPHSLIVIDGFSASETIQDAALFTMAVGRNDRGDRLPDDLARRVAEQAFRTGVPAVDDPVESLANDGIVRRLDDRSQPSLNR